MPKKQYIIESVVDHDNERFEIGATIVLDDQFAEALLAAKAIKIDANAQPIVDAPTGPTDAKERVAAIVTAIGQLDPNNLDLWLRDGKPSAEAIVTLLGWPISAAERNAAWDLVKPNE